MSASVSLTEDTVLATVIDLLVSVLPPEAEVVRGQENRVGVPDKDNFVVVNPVGRTRLSWNRQYYDRTNDARLILQPTQLDFQVDFYGPLSDAMVQVATTVLFDGYAFDYFKQVGIDARVLFASEPRQLAFVGGENQYENRWEITVSIQANIVIAIPQQFADKVHVTLMPQA